MAQLRQVPAGRVHELQDQRAIRARARHHDLGIDRDAEAFEIELDAGHLAPVQLALVQRHVLHHIADRDRDLDPGHPLIAQLQLERHRHHGVVGFCHKIMQQATGGLLRPQHEGLRPRRPGLGRAPARGTVSLERIGHLVHLCPAIRFIKRSAIIITASVSQTMAKTWCTLDSIAISRARKLMPPEPPAADWRVHFCLSMRNRT